MSSLVHGFQFDGRCEFARRIRVVELADEARVCVNREVSNRSLCHIDANGCHAPCFSSKYPRF